MHALGNDYVVWQVVNVVRGSGYSGVVWDSCLIVPEKASTPCFGKSKREEHKELIFFVLPSIFIEVGVNLSSISGSPDGVNGAKLILNIGRMF